MPPSTAAVVAGSAGASPRRIAFAALALAACPLLAATEPPEAAELLRIGSFTGAPVETAGEYFDNELFREARSGDLFQELGDLDVSASVGKPGTDLEGSITYSRRVLDRHRELPEGATLADGDLSWFQVVNSARAKASLDVDYLSDPPGPFALGLHAESGFVLTAAETQPPRKLGPAFSRRLTREHLRDELRGYWDQRDARFRRHLLPRVGRSLLTILDGLASAVDRGFEDTEKGALYFEGFVEPMTLWVDLGFPLGVDLFTAADPRLGPGDGATYTAFLGISPLSIGARKMGLRTSYEEFFRLIRETTVIEEGGDKVLVRVRTIAAKGREIRPLKIRPELRLFVLRYGYTLFEDRRNVGRFRVADLVYRFDLGTSEGRTALEALLGEKNRVRPRAPIEAAGRGAGVRILSAETRDGDRRDASLLARFPSFFRVKSQDLALLQDVRIGDAVVREATQGRRRGVRVRRFGPRRDQGSTDVLTLQTGKSGDPDSARPRALEVRTTLRDRHAPRTARETTAALWRALPGAPEPPPELAGTEDLGLVASFVAGLRGDALARLAALTDEEIWRPLGAIFGAGDAWATPEERAAWRAAPGQSRAGRRRLARAERFVGRFERLRGRLASGTIGDPHWARGTFRRDDYPLLVRLVLIAQADATDGGSFSAEIWTDEMPRPLKRSRGRSPIARLGQLAREPEPAPVGAPASSSAAPAEDPETRLAASGEEALAQVRDVESLHPSAPRLLAGRMFLRREPGAHGFVLSLFSDLRFAPDQRLRVELRRSRIRADLPLAVALEALGEPQPVPEGPFAISKYRYDVRLPAKLAGLIRDRFPYSVYLRVLNSQGYPLTEEEPLHFRVPKGTFGRKG